MIACMNDRSSDCYIQCDKRVTEEMSGEHFDTHTVTIGVVPIVAACVSKHREDISTCHALLR